MPPAADNQSKNTFRKRDKLKSSLEIDAVYRENHFLVSHPLKCYYSFSEINENKSNLRVAFAVPKRSFKHAIDRNIIKRRMREAYRLNYKKILETFIIQDDKQLKLFFIYTSKEIADFVNIEKSMLSVLNTVCGKRFQ
ncbi:MAG: ribonuclease P protein component [Bacteroidetes bacterium]|nr:ribonuclease P protein component [Bacteroidota bacterium]MCL1968778.1 ribonuclease P protein component [Bacteroidota bacterium]